MRCKGLRHHAGVTSRGDAGSRWGRAAGLAPDAVQLERGRPLVAARNLAHNALRPEALESFWCAAAALRLIHAACSQRAASSGSRARRARERARGRRRALRPGKKGRVW